MLSEFKWLKANASLVTDEICSIGRCKDQPQDLSHPNPKTKPDPSSDVDNESACCEAAHAARVWHARAHAFMKCCQGVRRLYRHLCNCQNRPLLYELLPYLRNLLYTVNLLLSYVKWMGGTGGLEKGFLGSGLQEPWVFRGGLVAEFQRMLPSHSLLDFDPTTARPLKESERPGFTSIASSNVQTHTVRPYFPSDKVVTYEVCKRSVFMRELFGVSKLKPSDEEPDIGGDIILGPLLSYTPELVLVIEDDIGLYGFGGAVEDTKKFFNVCRVSWIPEMMKKYPKPLDKDDDSEQAKMIKHFHTFNPYLPPTEILEAFPGLLRMEFLPRGKENLKGALALVTTLKLALKAKGCRGLHVIVHSPNLEKRDFLASLGFRTLKEVVHEDVLYHLLVQELD